MRGNVRDIIAGASAAAGTGWHTPQLDTPVRADRVWETGRGQAQGWLCVAPGDMGRPRRALNIQCDDSESRQNVPDFVLRSQICPALSFISGKQAGCARRERKRPPMTPPLSHTILTMPTILARIRLRELTRSGRRRDRECALQRNNWQPALVMCTV